jgi:hypothetical protein
MGRVVVDRLNCISSIQLVVYLSARCGRIFFDIIFSDESSIQLHQNKTVMYRLKGSLPAALPKPKHPFKVHVWGMQGQLYRCGLCTYYTVLLSSPLSRTSEYTMIVFLFYRSVICVKHLNLQLNPVFSFFCHSRQLPWWSVFCCYLLLYRLGKSISFSRFKFKICKPSHQTTLKFCIFKRKSAEI